MQNDLEDDIDSVRAARLTQTADCSGSLPFSEGPECVYISELAAVSTTERADDFGTKNPRLFGIEQNRSLLMHAKGDGNRTVSKTYTLGKMYAGFCFTVSIDDTATADKDNKEFGLCRDAVQFRVLGDDHVLWSSNCINSRNHAVKGKVNMTGVEELKLEVICPRGNASNSLAVWVDPRLFLAPGAIIDPHLLKPVNDIDLLVRNLHHEGNLEKKGEGFMDGWNERYFVLDGHWLRWFKNQAAYTSNCAPQNKLHLNDVIAVHHLTEKPKFFDVEVAGRTYKLFAQDPIEAMQWTGLFHIVAFSQDKSLRTIDEGTADVAFTNAFKVRGMKGDNFNDCVLQFHEDTGIKSVGGLECQIRKDRLHNIIRLNDGSHKFAIAELHYTIFEAANEAQLGDIERSFNTVMGDEQKPEPSQEMQVFKTVSLDGFENDAIQIGEGGQGVVLKVFHKALQKHFALKVIRTYEPSKAAKSMESRVNDAVTERDMLVKITSGSEFLVSLHSAWAERGCIFMCLELADKGDLYDVLQQHSERKLPLALAGFYISEVVDVIAYLHAQGVVYRDLKPENILIANGGHIKLTDFGLAKDQSRTINNVALGMDTGCNTMRGTPEYIAPEVIRKAGYGMAADWWCIGILFFEMLNGLNKTPFKTLRPGSGPRVHAEMFERIKKSPVGWPSPLPEWATAHNGFVKDLIDGLLDKDPLKRLGSTAPNSGDDVKRHPFFTQAMGVELGVQNFSFEKLPTIKAPYIPEPKVHRTKSTIKLESFTTMSVPGNNTTGLPEGALPEDFTYSHDRPHSRVNAMQLLNPNHQSVINQ